MCCEKRFCFTLDDQDVRAPAYEYFLTELGRYEELAVERLELGSVPWLLAGDLPDHLELLHLTWTASEA